ncbi:MAG: chorismate mutase [Solobacterium sp.]|nr:chorismate mutase [Solobacterium sp.]
MRKIEEIRHDIDEVDQELVKLFERRFHLVEEVIAYKMEQQLPIYDAQRELEILKKNLNRLNDTKLSSYFEAWYQKMLEISKQYQEERKQELCSKK